MITFRNQVCLLLLLSLVGCKMMQGTVEVAGMKFTLPERWEAKKLVDNANAYILVINTDFEASRARVHITRYYTPQDSHTLLGQEMEDFKGGVSKGVVYGAKEETTFAGYPGWRTTFHYDFMDIPTKGELITFSTALSSYSVLFYHSDSEYEKFDEASMQNDLALFEQSIVSLP
ncbi:MAG: hypothetical protein AAFQ98_09015 [Bacteroidota bacterium]